MEAPEIAIVLISGKWYVRRISSHFHDLNNDRKIYICDQPISGPHDGLADVPLVAELAAIATPEELGQAIAIIAQVASEQQTRARVSLPLERALAVLERIKVSSSQLSGKGPLNG